MHSTLIICLADKHLIEPKESAREQRKIHLPIEILWLKVG